MDKIPFLNYLLNRVFYVVLIPVTNNTPDYFLNHGFFVR